MEVARAERKLKTVVSRRLRMIALAGSALVFSSCGGVDGKTHLSGAKRVDFARSEIISNGPAVADGSSELLVVIHLMNSDGSAVTLYKPSYEILSGAGVQGSECTTSNNNGVSTCVLKATQPGAKKFSVTNVKIQLEKELLFSPPTPPGAVTGLVSAARFRHTSAAGHEISGTVGSVHSNLVKTGTGGWKIYGGPEGNALSR